MPGWQASRKKNREPQGHLTEIYDQSWTIITLRLVKIYGECPGYFAIHLVGKGALDRAGHRRWMDVGR